MNKHRIQFEYSSERLRRARRLYFYLVSRHIPDGEQGIIMVNLLSKRLQERGFYSMKTSIRDMMFRFYRQIYKHTKQDFEGWYEWQMRRGYGMHPWFRRVA